MVNLIRDSEESVGLNNSIVDEEFKHFTVKENHQSAPASGDIDY